ncbi:hypothetical protein [Microbacterium tumbae]
MTDTTPALKDRVLDRDDDLRDVLELLLERANRRQLWFLFIDERGCLGQPLMPMADFPEDPDEVLDVEGLGEARHARVLVHRAELLREATGNQAIVLAWERLGSSAVSAEDRKWARAVMEESGMLAVPVRAQFIVHNRGVRQLHPDDFL